MYRFVAVFMFASLVLGSSVAFAGVLGPVTPETKAGQFSLGTGIFYYQGELDYSGNDDEITQTHFYAQAGYGVTDNFEIYTQLGAADLEIGDMEDSYAFYGSAGFKGVVYEHPLFKVGLFGQGSYYGDYEEDVKGVNVEVTDMWEACGGVNIEKEMEGALLYAGVMGTYRELDVEAAGLSETVEEDTYVGSNLGVRWFIGDKLTLDIETQIKTDISVGTQLLYNF